MRHVALLIEATNAYARGLLHGIAKYNHDHARWTVYFEPHAPDQPPPKWLQHWKGHGIIARIANVRMAKAVLELGLPVVELRRLYKFKNVPSVGPDNLLVAELAAQHLRERGLRNFGFYGFPPGADPPLDTRAAAFQQAVERLGCTASLFRADRNLPWEAEQKQLIQWVKSLPKPVGIMACTDERGLQVLRACMLAGLKVPDQVAVIGAGNDDCICDLCEPPLTSVDLAPESIGYEAAALLDRMMSGKRPPQWHIQVPPRGIITRPSTDVLATDDSAVAEALRFIRTRACAGIRVTDVLKSVHLSRSALEPRLKKVIGRSIHQEIRRVRLERAKDLLATTDLPIKQIADQTGFRTVQYLARVFRSQVGQTPAAYRKKMRRLHLSPPLTKPNARNAGKT